MDEQAFTLRAKRTHRFDIAIHALISVLVFWFTAASSARAVGARVVGVLDATRCTFEKERRGKGERRGVRVQWEGLPGTQGSTLHRDVLRIQTNAVAARPRVHH